jgi:hypothetical protein
VFDEDNPEEAKVVKPTALLSFLNVNEGNKNIKKCKHFKNKRHFMASTAITDLVIRKKKRAYQEPNPGGPHCRHTCYQLFIYINIYIVGKMAHNNNGKG